MDELRLHVAPVVPDVGRPGHAQHDPRRAVGDGSAREVRDLA
jgi:hypothetical protein